MNKLPDQYLEKISQQTFAATNEFLDKANLTKGKILIVGCSSSEVCGNSIGSSSNLEVAEAIFNSIYQITNERSLYLAVQCCEHLNRAIIVEREAVPFSDIVNVVPQPKAGGSFATIAYRTFKAPVAIEEIRADAGLDIGDTLIGMHLKKVAVPIRLEHNQIGKARIIAAKTRPKFIGGERASYDCSLK